MLSIHGTKVSHSNRRKKSGRGRFLYKKERIAIGHNSFEPQQLNGSHDDFNNEVSEENFQACQAYGVSMNDGSSTTERRRIILPLARRNFSK